MPSHLPIRPLYSENPLLRFRKTMTMVQFPTLSERRAMMMVWNSTTLTSPSRSRA